MSHLIIITMGGFMLVSVIYEIYHIIKDEPESEIKKNQQNN